LSPNSNTMLYLNKSDNGGDEYVIFSEHSGENEPSQETNRSKKRNSTVLEGYEEDSEDPEYESDIANGRILVSLPVPNQVNLAAEPVESVTKFSEVNE